MPTISETLSNLNPIEVPYNKVRIGPPKDGGYVVLPELIKEDLDVVSFGVGKTVDFELQIAQDFGNTIHMYDHTIDFPPVYDTHFKFFSKGIFTLDDLEEVPPPSLLQCDIEGSEWGVFRSEGVRDWLKSVDQVIMEYHWLHNIKDGKWHWNIEMVLENFAEHFYAYHVHANNWRPTIDIDGKPLPDVIEVSYINKKYIDNPEPFKGTFPISGLDYPNRAGVPDIALGNFQW